MTYLLSPPSGRLITHHNEELKMRNRCGVAVKRWATALLVAGMGLAGSASALLIDRGPDLVYDDVLNITWTRNANLNGSSRLSVGDFG
jgi:hypothetical protein